VPCAEAQVIEPDKASPAALQPEVNPVAIFNVEGSRIGMLLGKNVSAMIYSVMTFRDQHLPRPAFAKSDAAMTTGSIFAARGLK
jgi:hypothetical protein